MLGGVSGMQAICTRPFSRTLYCKRYTHQMRSGDETSSGEELVRLSDKPLPGRRREKRG